jgi:isocitrate lyase
MKKEGLNGHGSDRQQTNFIMKSGVEVLVAGAATGANKGDIIWMKVCWWRWLVDGS